MQSWFGLYRERILVIRKLICLGAYSEGMMTPSPVGVNFRGSGSSLPLSAEGALRWEIELGNAENGVSPERAGNPQLQTVPLLTAPELPNPQPYLHGIDAWV